MRHEIAHINRAAPDPGIRGESRLVEVELNKNPPKRAGLFFREESSGNTFVDHYALFATYDAPDHSGELIRVQQQGGLPSQFGPFLLKAIALAAQDGTTFKKYFRVSYHWEKYP